MPRKKWIGLAVFAVVGVGIYGLVQQANNLVLPEGPKAIASIKVQIAAHKGY